MLLMQSPLHIESYLSKSYADRSELCAVPQQKGTAEYLIDFFSSFMLENQIDFSPVC